MSEKPPSGPGAWLWSLIALAVGVGLTFWVATHQHKRELAEQRGAFHAMAERSYHGIEGQLRATGLLVRLVQTLFLTSEEVTSEEFDNLYANLRPRDHFPSLRALAYARRESSPAGESYVTTLVVPGRGNERVRGLDVSGQPANLAAVIASRDSDQPALSGPFRLVQLAAQDIQADGVTMRLPIYSPGAPPDTVAARRARARGSIAVSFRIEGLIESALADDIRRVLHIRVTDITDGASMPLFNSHPGRAGVADAGGRGYRRDLDYGERTWRVEIQPLDSGVGAGWNWSKSALLPGLLATLLLTLLVWSIATTRSRALELGWRMSRQYRESEERFRTLNDRLPALVLLASARGGGRITYANQAARLRLGSRLPGKDLPGLFVDPAFRQQLMEPASAACSNVEVMLHGAGGPFWANLSISRLRLDDREQLLMVASDISEQRELTDLLSYQASHDALTEIFNRREFESRLEQELAAVAAGGPPAALLYIDLDQFKLINDTSGHIAGDQLLVQLAHVMHQQLRDGDMLARLGGDEFGILVCGVDDQGGARLVAERLRERIDDNVFVWEGRAYTISASIGGVMVDAPGATRKDLLAQADTACYMAKENGRNRVHFYSERDDETALRMNEMEWANRLRWAIGEQRLLLQYQEVWPLKLDLEGGPRVEILLRFLDEEGRTVVPGAFIPAAERYGLMPMIDRWVIETSLANFDRLHPGGADLQQATINLSGASIEDDSLADLILSLLVRHQVEPSRVCFEITETVAVRKLAQVSRFIERLREVGCRIALDDFGVGMSSFGYLKNLPVDIIKIDGSFIRDLLTDPMSETIVRAVTDIGHQRGMRVIAEWVTSQDIADALARLGVDYAQGFALHRPTPVEFQREAAARRAAGRSAGPSGR